MGTFTSYGTLQRTPGTLVGTKILSHTLESQILSKFIIHIVIRLKSLITRNTLPLRPEFPGTLSWKLLWCDEEWRSNQRAMYKISIIPMSTVVWRKGWKDIYLLFFQGIAGAKKWVYYKSYMVRSKSNVQDIDDTNVQCCMKKSLEAYQGTLVTDPDWSSHKVKCQRLKAVLSPAETLCQNGRSASQKLERRKLERMSLDDLVKHARQHIPIKAIKSAIITSMETQSNTR